MCLWPYLSMERSHEINFIFNLFYQRLSISCDFFVFSNPLVLSYFPRNHNDLKLN